MAACSALDQVNDGVMQRGTELFEVCGGRQSHKWRLSGSVGTSGLSTTGQAAGIEEPHQRMGWEERLQAEGVGVLCGEARSVQPGKI